MIPSVLYTSPKALEYEVMQDFYHQQQGEGSFRIEDEGAPPPRPPPPRPHPIPHPGSRPQP